ncbi:MAG: sigma-54 dependent transcriptional regulator [Dongiaceae bacterium]
MSSGTILFVDDEEQMRASVEQWLGLSDFKVASAADGQAALSKLQQGTFDAVLTDVRMPKLGGLDLLERIRNLDADLPVILLTGHGDIAMAVEAMRKGAYDFLEKPYDADHLVLVVRRAVERYKLVREVQRLRSAVGSDQSIDARLIGSSPAMAALKKTVRELASVDASVIIRGETGTGKEVVARCLHELGPRAGRPFVAIHCGAIPETIFESELFGHMPGAFTGASARRVGKFEFANGGTVLLDEIESMPLALQTKVLRVLQERVVEPLGSNKQIRLDIRVLAASKTDLRKESEAGRFRADLYFRLGVVEISVPPLRQRKEDIPLLFDAFVVEACRLHGRERRSATPEALALLMTQDWPGNVRELKAAAERFSLGLPLEGATETLNHAGPSSKGLGELVADYERQVIAAALEICEGSTARAADRLGIPRRTLNEKIQKYGLRAISS